MTNRKNFRVYQLSRFALIMVFSAMFLFFARITVSAQDAKNVLFISSYTESFASVPDQIEGLKSGFLGENINLEIEYMDTKRMGVAENILQFHDYLKYKLENLPAYDAIIVGDDAALQFAMDYQEELFPNIPIVFLGINDVDRARKADSTPYMAGSTEETSIEANIELAYKLNPQATTVVAIVDNTITGLGEQKQYEAAAVNFPDLNFEYLNSSEHSYAEIGQLLGQYPSNTILLYLCMNEDITGVYWNLNDKFKLIADNASVPVYRTTVGGVGQGILGGRFVSYVDIGKYSASLVVKILNGTDINSIALMEDTPYYYCFDYSLIKKYKIDESLIPAGAIYINKTQQPFEKYGNYVIICGIIFLFFIIMICILIIDNIKTKIMKKRLQESHEELTASNEELSASEEILQSQYDQIQMHSSEIDTLYQKYDIAIRSTGSAVWELDVATDELLLSENFSKLLNKKFKQPEKAYVVRELAFHQDYREKFRQEIISYINGEISEINMQIPTRDEDGPRKWLLIRGKGIQDYDNDIKKIYGIFLDITAIKEQEEYISYLAAHDYLTNLPNRMEFMSILSVELINNSKGTVFLLDIDNFKAINDTLGHIYGDILLKQIADRLINIQDKQMFVARLGGDEFLILLKEVSEYEKINQYVQKIKNIFSEPFSFDGNENFINFSMGITCYPEDSNNINQLIMNADTAMYKVKQSGRNNYVYYQEEMKNEMEAKRSIESLLRQSIKENGFQLFYQPQVNTKTGEISSFEALLRIKNHNLSPGVFIPIAEESGCIIEIGRWVAREAIQQIAHWRSLGFAEKPVAINYSSKQMRDKGFIDYLNQVLEEYEVNPKYLEIEITEGILLENNLQTLEFLGELKNSGFNIALDDFGTGYSSLNYLTYIPVDIIKLDKSINDKFLDFKDTKVMDSLISLSHSLGLKIIAEGIEDWDKYIKLRDGGCDYIQGYLFSKPVDSVEIEGIYDKNFLKRE